jgi:hypothetical protein
MDDTSEDSMPTELPYAPSDRDKAMINRMFRQTFSWPPARQRKRSRTQRQRQRAKDRKSKNKDVQ